jgi:hypothetical protein
MLLNANNLHLKNCRVEQRIIICFYVFCIIASGCLNCVDSERFLLALNFFNRKCVKDMCVFMKAEHQNAEEKIVRAVYTSLIPCFFTHIKCDMSVYETI